ncbi:MAG: hypothetical protein C4338_03055 [Rhodanobacteraceae bacterium]
MAAARLPGIGFNYSIDASAGYINTVLANGGNAPPWLANPPVEMSIGTDTVALRNAEWVVDFGKVAPWLEHGGHALGLLGVGVEFADGVVQRDPATLGHAGMDGAVLVASTAVGGLAGFAVGATWTGLDMAVQHYS